MIAKLTGLMLLALLVVVRAWAKQDGGAVDEVKLGNEAYARFDNHAALQHFLQALEIAPNHYQALRQGARAHADVGKAIEKSNKNRARKLYARGDSLARKCVALYPDSAEAHFVLALCVGRVAMCEGGKTKIRLSQEVKKEAEAALAINSGHDGAYHVLGRWHYNIATLDWIMKAAAKVIYGGVPPGASLEQAAQAFAKAVEINGSKPVHRLEYGRTLAKLERYAEARSQLQECMNLAQVQWEDGEHQAEAARLLKEIEGRKEKT